MKLYIPDEIRLTIPNPMLYLACSSPICPDGQGVTMNFVYLLERCADWPSTDVIRVFSSFTKAEEKRKEYERKEDNPDVSYMVREMEIE
jgi:hypothetical protein